MTKEQDKPDRIILRACTINGPRDAEGHPIWGHMGVVLPDGRIIMTKRSPINTEVMSSFSSEAALQREYPGATIHYWPEADEYMNAVDPGDA